MKIPQSSIGNFQSTKQNEAYLKAESLKSSIDEQIDVAPRFDGQREVDQDFAVPGRVRFVNTNLAKTAGTKHWTAGPSGDLSGTIEYEPETKQTLQADIHVRDYTYMNVPTYDLSYRQTESTETYQKKENFVTETLAIDKATGDWEFSRKALGFIPLPT